jgi:hypothetical protein
VCKKTKTLQSGQFHTADDTFDWPFAAKTSRGLAALRSFFFTANRTDVHDRRLMKTSFSPGSHTHTPAPGVRFIGRRASE